MTRTPVAAVLFDVVRGHDITTIAVGLAADMAITFLRVDERPEPVRLTVDEQREIARALVADLDRRRAA